MVQGSDGASGDLGLRRLIKERMAELGVRRSEFARRMGYSNISKGCRRIDQMIDGDLHVAVPLRTMLATGLAVEVEAVDQAIETTEAQLHAASSQAYCADFEPHAIVLCENDVPSPIFVYVLAGSASLHTIPMPAGASPDSFAERALERLPDYIPGLGRTTGFVVNYAPDSAVEFDERGNAVGVLETAHRIGHANLRIGGVQV